MAARASASRQTSHTNPMERFPCGLIELERAVERRTCSRPTALWVRCGQCNLTALIATTPPRPVEQAPAGLIGTNSHPPYSGPVHDRN